MKVERDNYRHWLLLIISGCNVFFSMPFRLFRNKKKKRVIFYYQPDGNSRALIDYLQRNDPNIELYVLAFPKYLRIYKGQHTLPTLNMLNPLDMITVAQSNVVITNYNALTLVYYAKFTSLKFVDVWHGLPLFKNQTSKIMNYLNYYSEVWVSSPWMKQFYRERYRLRSNLIVTGYGRTDMLVNGDYDKESLRQKYNLPNKKILLIAPTWKHNNPDRSIYPFDMNANDFLQLLSKISKKANCCVVFRSHMLSSGSEVNTKNIKALPSQQFPNTEEILAMADIVVTDWSSLVFDYMATHRPVLFFDGEPPFVGEEAKTRFSPENRFGPILKTSDDFLQYVVDYIHDPQLFFKEYAQEFERAKDKAYGDMLDGHALERYYERIVRLLK